MSWKYSVYLRKNNTFNILNTNVYFKTIIDSMNKAIQVLLYLFFIAGPLFAQQKELARFYVLKATVDGQDVTSQVVSNDAYTVFYETELRELYMANVWAKPKTQSWGPVYNFYNKNHKETRDSYEADEFIFDWSFRNSYDSDKGVCSVSFTKVYKPQGVVSILRIRNPKGGITEYIGYMKGTIDFSKY